MTSKKLLILGEFGLFRDASGDYFASEEVACELAAWKSQFTEYEFFSTYQDYNNQSNIKKVEVKGRLISTVKSNHWLFKWLLIPSYLFLATIKIRNAQTILFRMPNFWSFWTLFLCVFFRKKQKFAIYETNWSWGAPETWANRFQQWSIKSLFLFKNLKVLSYGLWTDAPYHVFPYFKPIDYSIIALFKKPKKSFLTNRNFLWVGDFRDETEWAIVLEFFYKWRKQFQLDQLVMIGNGSSEKVKESISILRLKSRVHVVQDLNRSAIRSHMISAHYFISLPNTITWPTIVLEAMAAGCIPIVTRAGVLPEIIGFGSRGIPVRFFANDILEQLLAHESIHVHFSEKSLFISSWSHDLNIDRLILLVSELVNANSLLKSSEIAIYR